MKGALYNLIAHPAVLALSGPRCTPTPIHNTSSLVEQQVSTFDFCITSLKGLVKPAHLRPPSA